MLYEDEDAGAHTKLTANLLRQRCYTPQVLARKHVDGSHGTESRPRDHEEVAEVAGDDAHRLAAKPPDPKRVVQREVEDPVPRLAVAPRGVAAVELHPDHVKRLAALDEIPQREAEAGELLRHGGVHPTGVLRVDGDDVGVVDVGSQQRLALQQRRGGLPVLDDEGLRVSLGEGGVEDADRSHEAARKSIVTEVQCPRPPHREAAETRPQPLTVPGRASGPQCAIEDLQDAELLGAHAVVEPEPLAHGFPPKLVEAVLQVERGPEDLAALRAVMMRKSDLADGAGRGQRGVRRFLVRPICHSRVDDQPLVELVLLQDGEEPSEGLDVRPEHHEAAGVERVDELAHQTGDETQPRVGVAARGAAGVQVQGQLISGPDDELVRVGQEALRRLVDEAEELLRHGVALDDLEAREVDRHDGDRGPDVVEVAALEDVSKWMLR